MMREKGTNRAAFLRGEVDRYTWVEHGSSFVLADLLAALLEAHLRRLDELQARRTRWAAYYLEALDPLQQAGLLGLPFLPPDAGPNWHLFHFTVATEEERDRCLRFLRARGIGAAFHFVPLHSSPYGQHLTPDGPMRLPVTDRVSRTLIRIPLHAQLSAAEAEHVVDSIYEFFNASLILREPPPIRWGQPAAAGSSLGRGADPAMRQAPDRSVEADESLLPAGD
jgi:dTDP-4-amino-4,6-dideoxygalactose transaminase